MEGRQHEMPGLRRGERERDAFGIAHLADQDHVRVFSKSIAKAGREVADVTADLSLAHDRPGRAGERVLDRILERDERDRALAGSRSTWSVPWTRATGGSPEARWTSLAPIARALVRRSARSLGRVTGPARAGPNAGAAGGANAGAGAGAGAEAGAGAGAGAGA